MLIVSQNKVSVLNLDKVNLIGINGDGEVKARLGINDIAVLGIYKTEERAKEVLQEIVKAYTSMQILPFLQVNISDNIYGKDLAKVVACEMPQE